MRTHGLLCLLAGLLLVVAGCTSDDDSADEAERQRLATAQLETDRALIAAHLADKGPANGWTNVEETPSGLVIVRLVTTQENQAQAGQFVRVHYVGQFLDGRVFDTSRESVARAQNIFSPNRDYAPISFQLGTGRVIRGWDEGIALLRRGERAVLLIPSGLAYGPGGSGGAIPPNAVLEFDVELIDAGF